MEQGLTKQQIVSALMQNPHVGGVGKRKKGEKRPKLSYEQKQAAQMAAFDKFQPIASKAAEEDGEFLSKLIVWNHVKGAIRDSKVALPVLALKHLSDTEYQENALAHLADLRPREFLRAVQYARYTKAPSRVMDRLIERYLRDLEANLGEWEKTAVLHRKTLATLYAYAHVKPAPFAQFLLRKGMTTDLPRFRAMRELRTRTPEEVAHTVKTLKLNFLSLRAALKGRLKEPDILCAVIAAMTPQEVIKSTKMLEKLGVKTVPAARAAFEQALAKAAQSKKTGLSAAVAADAVEDEQLAGKLRTLQEKQLDNISVEGNWLVAGDKSSSMARCIDVARYASGLLARMVKGRVQLVFFDTQPRAFDVTRKTLEEIQHISRGVTANGSTSVGCALDYCIENGIAVDGIVIVSDGEENTSPRFNVAYAEYVKKFGNRPTVYFYWVGGSGQPLESSARDTGMQTIDLRHVDITSIPNVVMTMKVGRYSLIDEVMAQDLKTVDAVLDRTKGFVATCLPKPKTRARV